MSGNRGQRPPAIGETINPYRMFYSALVPRSLLKVSGIGDGAKLLYGLLAYYAGKDGGCFPRVDTLAREMGVSEDTITRRLTELEKRGFIARIRRGPSRPTSYLFKLHRSLSESMRCATDPADLRDQEDSESLTPQICGDDPADLRCTDPADLRGAYREEGIPSEGIQKGTSSSFETASSRTEPEQPIESTTTKSVSLSEPEPIPFEHARETLRRLRYGRDAANKGILVTDYPLPDPAITNQIISGGYFEGKADFDRWALFFDSKGVKFRNHGYGLLPTDAKAWPDNRASYQAPEGEVRVVARDMDHWLELQAPKIAAAEAEKKRVSERIAELITQGQAKGWKVLESDSSCHKCAGFGLIPETGDYCTCYAALRAKHAAERLAKCPRCGGDGYTFTEPEQWHFVYSWCACEHAEKLKVVDPGYVDQRNAASERMHQSELKHKERREREEREKAEKLERKASRRSDFTTPGQLLTAPNFAGWAVSA